MIIVTCIHNCFNNIIDNKVATFNKLAYLLQYMYLYYYPSPTRSVCEDTLVGVLASYPEHVYTWEGYSNHSVSYPEHVYTWEEYSSHSVSSYVCRFNWLFHLFFLMVHFFELASIHSSYLVLLYGFLGCF